MSEKRFDPRNKNSLDFMTEREYALYSQRWSSEGNQEIVEQALNDPTFDYFDHLHPMEFRRPKYQIGRYALKNGIPVPLVRSQAEWEKTMQAGAAFLRSERAEDYTGPSGLDKSHHVALGEEIYAPSIVSDYDVNETLQRTLLAGLRDGTVGFDEYSDILNHGTDRGYGFGESRQTYSPWKLLDGINLSVMRDPVVDGRYYIGHTNTHHYVWSINDGRDSDDLTAFHNSGAHFRAQRNQLYPQDFQHYKPIDYTLPVAPLIDMYEAVRTLPYFDQRQAPVMELQYSKGRYHFLQYLKTNRLLHDPGEFQLPEGQNVARTTTVLGATAMEGERMRIYIDAKPEGSVPNEGFYVSHTLAYSQKVAMGAKAIIWDHFLGMKTNHYSGSFLTRPPVVFGLWGSTGDLEEAINKVNREVDIIEHSQQVIGKPWGKRPVYYIEANLTSNGREGTVESDWQIRTHDA